MSGDGGQAGVAGQAHEEEAMQEYFRLIEFAKERAIEGSRFYRTTCVRCRTPMRTDLAGLKLELEGMSCLLCEKCEGKPRGSYGGSPQESHDIKYHGSRFGQGEW